MTEVDSQRRSRRGLRLATEVMMGVALIAVAVNPAHSPITILLLAASIVIFFVGLLFLRRWPSA